MERTLDVLIERVQNKKFDFQYLYEGHNKIQLFKENLIKELDEKVYTGTKKSVEEQLKKEYEKRLKEFILSLEEEKKEVITIQNKFFEAVKMAFKSF